VRSHFPVPNLSGDQTVLAVGGAVDREIRLSVAELRAMPAREMAVTLECAGNGRTLFEPAIDGEPWALGAVSTARWRGALLTDVLERAGADRRATHLVFGGADGGFERGLSFDDARDSMLAYEMNGAPLPQIHGGPLRLVVPDWYAVASVKWLTSITVALRPFEGHFQTERYVFRPSEPVTLMRVRSLITQPDDGTTVAAGDVVVRGLAWSGSGPIVRVEVSVDGDDWAPAELSSGPPHAWQSWSHTIRVPRHTTVALRSRATDAARHVQPQRAAWNRLGYGNNSIQTVTVRAS